jgi:hypothetical protein
LKSELANIAIEKWLLQIKKEFAFQSLCGHIMPLAVISNNIWIENDRRM